MKQRTRIGKKISAAVLALCLSLLSGCAGTIKQREQGKAPIQMSVLISSDAPQNVKQAAEEFINRVEYYSEGELEIDLSESQQIDSVLKASDTEFAFVQNEELTDYIEELKTLELPFFFKHADYQFSALNSERVKKRLNQLIGAQYPMQVQMTTVCGYEDLAADGTVDLTDFRKRYPLAVRESFFSNDLQQDIGAQEIVTTQPLELLLSGEAEIAQAELSQVINAVSAPDYDGKMVLFTPAQRIKTIYLLTNSSMLEGLSAKQQAAIEQAAVMACGYCRTLADQKREQDLEQLKQLGVEVQQINLEKYFAMMGDIYQEETERMLYRPDTELDRAVRSNGAKETF